MAGCECHGCEVWVYKVKENSVRVSTKTFLRSIPSHPGNDTYCTTNLPSDQEVIAKVTELKEAKQDPVADEACPEGCTCKKIVEPEWPENPTYNPQNWTHDYEKEHRTSPQSNPPWTCVHRCTGTYEIAAQKVDGKCFAPTETLTSFHPGGGIPEDPGEPIQEQKPA